MPKRFEFLADNFPKLAEYGTVAENCINSDPNICLLSLGRIAELITKILCRQNNIIIDTQESTQEITRQLLNRGIITEDISQKINTLSEIKHDAADFDYSSDMACSRLIATAEELCEWFVFSRSEGKFNFLAELFPPGKPVPILINLAELGREAEENLYSNTRYCLICLGDFGEAAADRLMIEKGIETHEKDQIDRIDVLSGSVDKNMLSILHELRIARNKALHERYNDEYNSEKEASRLLDEALKLSEYLFRLIIKNGYILKARITGEKENGGFSASIGIIRAFVPSNEITESRSLIKGRKYVFKIIDTEQDIIKLSLNDADNDYNLSVGKLYAKYKPGQDVNVKIKSMSNSTGAIVELKDGLEARIPPSELGKKIYRYDDKTNQKLLKYETTARVKWFSLKEYPPMLLSVKDVEDEQKEHKEQKEKEHKEQKIKTAMSDLDFRLLCKTGSYGEVLQALEDGANPNAKNNRGTTALMMAAQFNRNSKVVKALIEAGADIDAKNHKGNTALMYAAMRNNPETVRAIYDAGADIEAVNGVGKKAADYAMTNRKLNGTDIVRLLKDEPETQYYEIELPDHEGHNNDSGEDRPLTQEQEEESRNVLKITLQKDFLKICRSGSEEEISEAVNTGVNVNVTNKSSSTALMFAAQSNTAGAVEILINAGACIDAQDDKGNTALIYAASFNTDDVVDVLINAGADKAVTNSLGRKAADYAKLNYRLADTEALNRLEG